MEPRAASRDVEWATGVWSADFFLTPANPANVKRLTSLSFDMQSNCHTVPQHTTCHLNELTSKSKRLKIPLSSETQWILLMHQKPSDELPWPCPKATRIFCWNTWITTSQLRQETSRERRDGFNAVEDFLNRQGGGGRLSACKFRG